MKRFTLATLLAVAMIVSAAAMAEAGNTQKLTPPRESPFPNASGVVSTTFDGPYYRYYRDWWGNLVAIRYYYVYATFQVWGLAPSTFYYLGPVGAFTTDGSGNAGGTGSDSQGSKKPPSYQVYDVNLVVVLK